MNANFASAAIKLERQFAKNGYIGEQLGPLSLYIEGSTSVVLSAPHAVKHYRRDRSDPEDADIYTGSLAIQLASLTKASALIYARTSKEDPNDDADGEYKRQLRDLVTQKQARFVLDFHGLAEKRLMQIAVGTGGNRENLLGRTDLLDILRNTLENAGFEIAEDAPRFKASRPNTISSFTRRVLGIPALQIEIHKDYRDPRNKPDAYDKLIRALDKAIHAIAGSL